MTNQPVTNAREIADDDLARVEGGLFSGSSGTGKTLGATLLGKESRTTENRSETP